MNPTLSKALRFVLFLGLGVFLLWMVARTMDEQTRQDTLEAIRGANYFWLGISLLFGILSHVSRAFRWRMLIKPLGKMPRLSITFFAVMIGYLANLAFPRLGEVMRCGVISRYEKMSADKVVGTMIAERSIDLLCLVTVTILTLILQYRQLSSYFNTKIVEPFMAKMSESGSLLLYAGIAVGVVLLGWFIFRRLRQSAFKERLSSLLANIKDGLMSVRKLENFPLFLAHTLFIWLMYFAMVWICFDALPETSSLGITAGLAILVFGSLGMIVTPGGIGAYQLIVSGLLVDLFGISNGVAVAFSAIVWGAQTAMIIVVGFLSMVILFAYRRRESAADQATGDSDTITA